MMKTVKASRRLIIPGMGIIDKGTEMKVVSQNSKFVYVEHNGKSVRLSKDKDVSYHGKFR